MQCGEFLQEGFYKHHIEDAEELRQRVEKEWGGFDQTAIDTAIMENSTGDFIHPALQLTEYISDMQFEQFLCGR